MRSSRDEPSRSGGGPDRSASAVGTQVLDRIDAPPETTEPTRRSMAHPLGWTVVAILAIALAVWFVAYWSVLHPPAVRPVLSLIHI